MSSEDTNKDAICLLRQYQRYRESYRKLNKDDPQNAEQASMYKQYFRLMNKSLEKLKLYKGHEFAKKKTKYSHVAGAMYYIILYCYYIKPDFTPNYENISKIIKSNVGFAVGTTTFSKCKVEAIIVFQHILDEMRNEEGM